MTSTPSLTEQFQLLLPMMMSLDSPSLKQADPQASPKQEPLTPLLSFSTLNLIQMSSLLYPPVIPGKQPSLAP